MIWRRTDLYNWAGVYFLGVTENVKSTLSCDRSSGVGLPRGETAANDSERLVSI